MVMMQLSAFDHHEVKVIITTANGVVAAGVAVRGREVTAVGAVVVAVAEKVVNSLPFIH